MEHEITLLADIALGIIFAAAAGHLARLAKQPPILGYVLGGVLLGTNLGFGLVKSAESINLISEIGLILLLFIIGLEINLRELMRMGKAMFTLSIVQFLGCAAIAAGCFSLAGYSNGAGNFNLLYISVALSLSSTLIVVKILHDKFEISSIAGQLTVGVLVLQDIWAIVFMAFQPNLLSPEFGGIIRSIGMGIALIALSFGVSRYILPRLFHSAGKSPELILLTAIAWCFTVCGLAEYAGLSKEMGALVAGISISAFPYGTDVISKVGGVRDFFVTLFFVSLGLKMPQLNMHLIAISLFAVGVVIISRLLSVIPTLAMLGKGTRTGAVTALNLAQISEFSLVILSIGATLGHVTADVQMVVLTSMMMTSVAATYLILFNDVLARGMVKMLAIVGIKSSEAREAVLAEKDIAARDIVLLGCFRSGMALLEKIGEKVPALKSRILVIDFNPSVQDKIDGMGYKWVYGDLAHPETLEHLHIGHACLVICSVSDTFLKGTTNSRLLSSLKVLAPDAAYVMTAEDNQAAEVLIAEGAFDVVKPHELAGERLLSIVCSRTRTPKSS